MSTSNKIGSVFVEVLTKGLTDVQRDLGKVRAALRNTAEYAGQMRKALSATPLSVALQIDRTRADIVQDVKDELAKIPKEARVKFVAEKIDAVKSEIAGLEKALNEVPDSKEIKAKIAGAEKLEADLTRALESAPSTKEIQAKLKDARKLQGDLEAALAAAPDDKEVTAKLAGASALVAELEAELAKVPDKKKIKAELADAQKLKNDLKKTLQEIPDKKEIKAKLLLARGLQADLNKELAGVKTPPGMFAGIGEAMNKAVAPVTAALNRIGQLSQRAFLGASAGMLAFARTADPVRFRILEGTFGALSVQIGSIFIPVLEALNKRLQAVLGWMRRLTPEQKASILHWAKMGLAVLAVVAIVPRIIGGIQAVGAALALFGVELGFATGGLSIILGLLAAAVPLVLALAATADSSGNTWGMFGEIFNTVAAALGQLYERVKPILAALESLFITYVRVVLNNLRNMATALRPIWDGFLAVLDMLRPVVLRLIDTVTPIIERFGEIWARVWAAIGPVVQTVVGYVIRYVQEWIPVFTAAVDFIGEVGDAIAEIFNEIANEIASLTGSFEDAGGVWEFVFGIIRAGFIGLRDAALTVFEYLRGQLQTLVQRFVFVATLLRELRNGNIRGALGAANAAMNAVAERQRTAPQRREAARERREREERQRTTTRTRNQVAPLPEQKVELFGLVDAWRKAQQALTNGRDSAETERLNLQREANGELATQTGLLQQIAGQDTSYSGSGGSWD